MAAAAADLAVTAALCSSLSLYFVVAVAEMILHLAAAATMDVETSAAAN